MDPSGLWNLRAPWGLWNPYSMDPSDPCHPLGPWYPYHPWRPSDLRCLWGLSWYLRGPSGPWGRIC